jgi:hypothetical protein
MAVQGHAPAAEEQRRAVVGVARALGRRALVLLLLGIDTIRAVEPHVPPRLPRPAHPKVLNPHAHVHWIRQIMTSTHLALIYRYCKAHVGSHTYM